MCYQLVLVSLHQHRGDLKSQKVTIKVTGSSEETPLSMVRLCGLRIPPNRALI